MSFLNSKKQKHRDDENVNDSEGDDDNRVSPLQVHDPEEQFLFMMRERRNNSGLLVSPLPPAPPALDCPTKDVDEIEPDCFNFRMFYCPMGNPNPTEGYSNPYGWWKTYDPKVHLPRDIMAGLTVAIMLIPQSMSYAKLAGLPVQYGLYSGFTPLFAYAIAGGTSPQLAVGPVALVSLLLQSGITSILVTDNTTDTTTAEFQNRYIQLAIQTAFLVGCCKIGLSFCRCLDTVIAILLPHAVISGFTTGAALMIAMSQVKYILGYTGSSGGGGARYSNDNLFGMMFNYWDQRDDFHVPPFLLGILSILCLVIFKNLATFCNRVWLRAMGPLFVSGIGLCICYIATITTNPNQSDDATTTTTDIIPMVGEIPKGLPSLSTSQWSSIGDKFGALITTVLSIVVVGFMESLAISKQLAVKLQQQQQQQQQGYENPASPPAMVPQTVDASRELWALGVANFVGSAFSAYPVTGSFSRSAVNSDVGAVSVISGMVTAVAIGMTLLCLTPIMKYLPLCILAAIVITGVIPGLLDFEHAWNLWKEEKQILRCCSWCVAFIGTIAMGAELGLAVAILFSLITTYGTTIYYKIRSN